MVVDTKPQSTGRSQDVQGPVVRRRRSPLAANYPWWFAIPALLVIVGLFVVPNALNLVYPFTDWSAFKSKVNFVGLDTIRGAFEDGTLVTAVRTTVIYAVLVATFQNIAGLGLAALLERDTRINRFVRLLFFAPMLISALAVGYIFQALLTTSGGLNSLLSSLTGTTVAIPWLGSTTWTIVVVTLVHSWKWVGLSMLIYIAGLSTVPGELKEAAVAMGASRWDVFRHVKLPFLAPAITYNVTVTVIGAMSTFDIVLATTRGGPGNATRVLNVLTLDQFGIGYFGLASATQLVVTILVTLTAIPLIGFLRRRELEG